MGVDVQEFDATSPAMDHNGVIASSHLYHDDLLNDISDCFGVRAPPIRVPVHNVELCHLVGLPRLW